MAPGYAADGVKTLAQDFGGEFHDTGFMAGVWADLIAVAHARIGPAFLRRAGRPGA